MASSSGFLAGGLADLGSQVATGLLGGQELLAREQERRRLAQHQTFLDRLNLARLAAEQQKLAQPTLHGNRGVFPLPSGGYEVRDLSPTPETPLQGAQRASAEATRAWREKQIKALDQPKGPTDPIKVLETGISEALQREDTATAEKLESVLKRLTSLTQKPTKEPASLDALLAKASDPTVPADERQRAQQQADKIIEARKQITREGAESHSDIKKKEQQEKIGKQFAATYTLLNQLDKLIPAMEKKGFLSAGDDAASAAMAAARRSRWIPGIGKPGDPDLTAWRAHAGTMVAILRQLGDIGPRAIAAYQSAIDVIEHPTTAEGAKKAFKQLRTALDAARTGEVGDTEPPSAPTAGARPTNDPLGIRR